MTALLATMGRRRSQVALLGGDLGHAVPNGQTARTEFQLTITGDERHDENGVGLVTVGQWLITGSADQYDVIYEATGDIGSLLGDPPNVWKNLATGFSIYYNISTNNFERLCAGNVKLRRASDQSELTSAALNMSVTVGTPP